MYCNLLNFFDPSIDVQVTINNKKKNKVEFESNIIIPLKHDGYDEFRKEYNVMQKRAGTEGKNDSVKEKYITMTIEAKSHEEARSKFFRLENEVMSSLKRLGSTVNVLDTKERLSVLHDFFRQGHEGEFIFRKENKQTLTSYKDLISPDSFEFKKDYFMMAKTIKGHIDFSVGFKHQDITFIYVQDLVQAVFLTFNRGKNGRKYFLSDGNIYNSTEFSNYIHENLGRPWWIRIKAPIFILRLATLIGEYAGKITGKISALNNDKYNILKQRNWRCNIEPAVDELGFHPQYDLKRGTELAIKWYKENKWL